MKLNLFTEEIIMNYKMEHPGVERGLHMSRVLDARLANAGNDGARYDR